MRGRNTINIVLSIALVCLMLGSMLGGLPIAVNSVSASDDETAYYFDPNNGDTSIGYNGSSSWGISLTELPVCEGYHLPASEGYIAYEDEYDTFSGETEYGCGYYINSQWPDKAHWNWDGSYVGDGSGLPPGVEWHGGTGDRNTNPMKVLVYAPWSGKSCVAVIGDSGPAPWTGRQFGVSNNVFDALGLPTSYTKADGTTFNRGNPNPGHAPNSDTNPEAYPVIKYDDNPYWVEFSWADQSLPPGPLPSPCTIQWSTNIPVNDVVGKVWGSPPSITVDDSGNADAVWVDTRIGSYDVFHSHYTRADNQWSTNIPITPPPPPGGLDSAAAPVIAKGGGSGTHDVIAVWADDREGNWDIYSSYKTKLENIWRGERLDTTTVALNTKMNDDAGTSSQDNPYVTMDRFGNAYAVWRDCRNGNADIYFSYFSYDQNTGDGNWGGNVPVNDDTGVADQNSPVVAVDSSGNAYAIWADFRDGAWAIYFSYRPAGGDWGHNEKVSDNLGTASYYRPAIAVDGNGNVYALWADHREGNPEYQLGNWDIYFAYRPIGGGWGGNIRINDYKGAAWHSGVGLAVDSLGNAWAIWADYRNGNWDIYSDYCPRGGNWGTDVPVNDDIGTATQDSPAIAVDGSGNAYAVWCDTRSTFPLYDLYFSYATVFRESPWPMFQHDAQHTGRSPFAGPGISPDPKVGVLFETKFPDGQSYFWAPVIGADGTIYFTHSFTENKVEKGGLYAVYPDGREKWFYPLPWITTSPALGPDGSIYLVYNTTVGGVLLAVNPDGTKKWESVLTGPAPKKNLTIATDGTVYLQTYSNLIALNPDNGEIKWRFETGETDSDNDVCPAIDQQGNVYFSHNKTLYALDSNGNKKWQKVFDHPVKTPSIGQDGTIYLVEASIRGADGETRSAVCAVDPQSSEIRWSYIDFHGPGPPSISPEGNIYIAGGYNPDGTWRTVIFGYDSQGKPLGNPPGRPPNRLYQTAGWGGWGFVDLLLIDKEGIIYGVSNTTIKALDKNGNEIWSKYLVEPGDCIVDSICLSQEGIIYVPGSKKIYTLGSAPTDTTSPIVLSTSPEDGTTGVGVDTVVTATFNEAMDSSTITTESFTLAGSAVSGTVTYDPATYTATFTPDTNLNYGHDYTATLSTDIKDIAGNSLAEAYAWSFTTSPRAPKFLTLPFRDPDIKIQQGWIYTFNPDPNAHQGLDYIKGEIDNSSTWQSFDVVAAADGVAMQSTSETYGTFVLIRHNEIDSEGNNYFTLYAHLDNVTPKIVSKPKWDTGYSTWTPVKRGEVIGQAGSTGVEGHPEWIHLHFEVNRGGYTQNRIDPYDLYNTRDFYPRGNNHTVCGSNYLWTTDPPNYCPVANDQSVTTDKDTAKAITLTATDVDGDTLTYSIADSPTHGSLSGTTPNVTYTPDADFVGSDTFTYTVSDGRGGTDTATVWIGVGVENSKTETTSSGDDTVDATTEADTVVDKSGAGTPTITVAEYSSNPGTGFSGDTGKYIDVHIDDPTGVTQIIIKVYYTDAEIAGLVESSLRLRWWDGTTWVVCSDSGVDTTDIPGPPPYSGYMWAKIRSIADPNPTIPTLEQLVGTAFGGGGNLAGGGGGGGGGANVIPTVTGLVGPSLTLDANGIIQATCRLKTNDGRLTLDIAKGTRLLDSLGKPLTSLSAVLEPSPPAPPSSAAIILAYNLGRSRATFNPSITLTIKYDPLTLPEDVAEEDLYIAYWDGSKWVALETTVDTMTRAASCQISHFTTFALIGAITPPVPATFSVSNLSIQPAEVQPNDVVNITLSVANTGGTEGSYSVALKINGVKEAEKSVTIAPGSSQSVSFSVTKEEAGSYSVNVNGLSGSFTVIALASQPAAPPEAKPPISWTLIGIIAAVVVVGLLVFFLTRRRAY